jgi:hypothetical protein
MGIVTNQTTKYQKCIDACKRCAQACDECFAACLAEPGRQRPRFRLHRHPGRVRQRL